MMDIFEEILSALKSEPQVMLATIVSTSGSTPAPAFSKMLLKEGGRVSVGTVGGGCMEGDVLVAAGKLFETKQAGILSFHLNEDEYVQGLICGGSLDVLIEPVTKQDIPLFSELKTRRENGDESILATLIGPDHTVVFRRLVRPEPPGWNKNDGEALHAAVRQDLSSGLHKALYRYETQRVVTDAGELILEPISGVPSLIIFGGGHVSKYLSTAASLAGFRVTVVDDRPQFANPKRFPEAERTLVVPFEHAVREAAITASSYVVIVTRGHRADEEILEQVLETPAAYIGMIGSKRKVLKTYERLMEREIAVEALNRVFAPVGLEIGAVTPEEITISIVAQLIRVRRGEKSPPGNKSDVLRPLIALRKQKLSFS